MQFHLPEVSFILYCRLHTLTEQAAFSGYEADGTDKPLHGLLVQSTHSLPSCQKSAGTQSPES